MRVSQVYRWQIPMDAGVVLFIIAMVLEERKAEHE